MAAMNLFKHCRKIIGIGKNYPVYVGGIKNPIPTEPLLFLKPPSSMIAEGQPIVIPDRITELHHEVELGVVIGKNGSNISTDSAMQHVLGYTLALDMTAKCQLDIAMATGTPWSLVKCWDTFCPISPIIDPSAVGDPDNVGLWLKVDGDIRQNGSTNEMVFGVAQLISYCSKVMRLEEGDVILTGSPSGVGPVRAGEVIECGLDGIKEMKVHVERYQS